MLLTASAMTGFLIYYGSKALGITIPEVMMGAMSTTSLSLAFWAFLVPSASGMLLAWYSIRCIHSGIELAYRVLILISTFILVMFIDVYKEVFGASVDKSGLRYLLPNLSFTISLSLYMIFKYKTNGRR
ncbi:MAG: hypothetical protein FJY67_11045 [Calditrichaeota bacterium]|nr:hypothetical protein [Calditrichota bacterium]